MKMFAFLRWLLIALPIASILLLSLGCAETLTIGGNYMEPTINDGQSVAVDRNAYRNTGPERGDIILISVGADQGVFSRVIGLPGETIVIEDGAVYLNGTLLNEPYLAPGTRTESDTREYIVPEDSYFVLGDNRTAAPPDSRQGGGTFVQRGAILAKVNL